MNEDASSEYLRHTFSKEPDNARRALEGVEHDRNPLVLAQVSDSLRS